MPPPKHRKKPFSAKQRKEQLKLKREKKTHTGGFFGQRNVSHGSDEECSENEDDAQAAVRRLNQQPSASDDKKYDPNRYRLHFAADSRAEIDKRKKIALQPFDELPESALEVDLDDIYRPGTVLDMPKRPAWDFKMSKSALEQREEHYFKQYLDSILEMHSIQELSYFELNLETWRQLWRVLEMADVILLITDIRHPALHFSPAFHKYVTEELKKPLILVLNKIDLAPPSLVAAWRHYFQNKFPDIHVVCFTSFPRDRSTKISSDPGKALHKHRRKRAFSALGPKQLLVACEDIVQGKVDLTSWREKIEGEIAGVETEHEVHIHIEEVEEYTDKKHVRYRDDILTIGCCGYTNVGKSSLMNGLMGKKVVSVSKTPGHTKHFQTIYLTPTVKMCDSPGLVFPSLVPKSMQILAGIYPIAQVREPYSAVGYLAQRLPLPTLLRLRHPEAGDNPGNKTLKWTAFYICEAWAEKRGFLTAKAARHDTYRAANHILRMAVDGRLCLCTRPPGFTKQKVEWEAHKDTEEVGSFQTLYKSNSSLSDSDEVSSPTHSDLDLERDQDEDEETDEEVTPSQKEGKQKPSGLAISNPFDLLGDEDE